MHRVIRTNNPEADGCLKFHEISAIAPREKSRIVHRRDFSVFEKTTTPGRTALFLSRRHANLSWLFKDHLDASGIAIRRLHSVMAEIFMRVAHSSSSPYSISCSTRVGRVVIRYKSLWNVEVTTEKKGKTKLIAIKTFYIFIPSSIGVFSHSPLLLTYILNLKFLIERNYGNWVIVRMQSFNFFDLDIFYSISRILRMQLLFIAIITWYLSSAFFY